MAAILGLEGPSTATYFAQMVRGDLFWGDHLWHDSTCVVCACVFVCVFFVCITDHFMNASLKIALQSGVKLHIYRVAMYIYTHQDNTPNKATT